jgi:hypothetical protein
MKDIKWTDEERQKYIYLSQALRWSCHKMSKLYSKKRTPSAIKNMLERHGYTAIMGEPE